MTLTVLQWWVSELQDRTDERTDGNCVTQSGGGGPPNDWLPVRLMIVVKHHVVSVFSNYTITAGRVEFKLIREEGTPLSRPGQTVKFILTVQL